tara:strand:- start:586 stop:774 length:189 start_codon:yes stop_codon:yes gene_type:complete
VRQSDVYDHIKYINFMMGLLHDACNNLYEHLVDGDSIATKEEIVNINNLIQHIEEYTAELDE